MKVAIIGGTGVGSRLLELGGVPVHIPTEVGTVRGRKLTSNGVEILLLSRHSAGHKVPPHKVNYLGMARALNVLGIENCLSSAAVGCLRREWGPGTMVVCSDFYDLTYRNLTAFDRKVAHTDFTDPFGPEGRGAMLSAAAGLGLPVQDGGVYLGLNGPRYETPREIQLYGELGADLVGMTASTEAIVMRECGIDYACLAVVTNLAAGISETKLSHQEVEDEMKRSGAKAVQILLGAAESLSR